MVGLMHTHAQKICDLLLVRLHFGARPPAVFLHERLQRKFKFSVHVPYDHYDGTVAMCVILFYV